MTLLTSDVFYIQRGANGYKMSATQLKNFVGTNPSPDRPENAVEGDLWYDISSGILYVYNGTDWIGVGTPGSDSSSGFARVRLSETPPLNPVSGDLWFDTNDGNLYVWYVDSSQGQVTQVTIDRAGSGFDNGVIAADGGSGQGLSIEITVDGDNKVVGTSLDDPGFGYKTGDVVTLSNGTAQGTASLIVEADPITAYWVAASPGLSDGSENTLIFPDPNLTSEVELNGINYLYDGEKWTAGSVGGANVHIGTSPPSTAEEGDLWWDNEQGVLYIYYVDPDTSQWVQAAGSVTPEPPDLSIFYNKTEVDQLLSEKLDLTGGTLTGNLALTEVEITSDDFDLSDGNYFLVTSSFDMPFPQNAVAGISGVIKFTATANPTSWDTKYKFPNDRVYELTGESIVPFYVKSDNEILIGFPTGDYL